MNEHESYYKGYYNHRPAPSIPSKLCLAYANEERRASLATVLSALAGWQH